MLTYILRRLLLMPITLFGITVMVFCIARFAPGSPAQMQTRGEASMTAEEQQAQREYYERKFGLDLPLYAQYGRWWKSLFTREVQATAWVVDPEGTDDRLQPVFTLRRPQPEYYVRADDGQWYIVHEFDLLETVYEGDDDAFRELVSERDLQEHQPQPRPDYLTPTHVFADAVIEPIESLDEDIAAERLERAEEGEAVMRPIRAPAWSDDGQPLFVNPNSPDNPLVQVDGDWFRVLPQQAPSFHAITEDAVLQPKLGSLYEELPQQEDGYATPRHAIYFGTREPVDAANVPDDPERLFIEREIEVPSGIWVDVPGQDRKAMLWQQAELNEQPPLFVRRANGAYARLIGPTRAQPPAATIFMQDDEEFRARLAPSDEADLVEPELDERMPRHALLEGTLLDIPEAHKPTERQIRRYQHTTTIFEITLGESVQTGSTVTEELKRRLPVTLLINIIAFPLIYALAIPTGMIMAIKRGRFFDTAGNVLLLGFWSIPTVLSATLFIGYMGEGGSGVEWFPTTGLHAAGHESMPFLTWLSDLGWHIVLPVICITYGGLAYLAKQMRAAMLDNFTMDYVRTARAKGVRSKDIVFRHVLRNSLLPIITIFATILPAMIAGSIIIETIFSIEGMGQLAFRAVQSRDYDVVQSLALIAGALNLTGLLLADMCYAVADPRITYS